MSSEDKVNDKTRDNGNHPGAFLGGGAAGAAAGAAVGALGGPVGIVAGAAIGGLAGAKTGENFASMPDDENAYWRENFKQRPYAQDDNATYDDYEPGYQSGYRGSQQFGLEGRSFDEVEESVREDYDTNGATLEWERARNAARDSYERTARLNRERRSAENWVDVDRSDT